MPVNPLIPLAGRVAPFTGGNALLQGQSFANRKQLAEQSAEMHPLQVQAAQQGLDAGQQGLDANDAAKNMQLAVASYDHVQNLMKMPAPQRFAVHDAFESQMRDLGHDIDEVPDDLSDSALAQMGAALEPIASRFNQQRQKPAQFGGQVVLKDTKGNLFLGTGVNDPSTGQSSANLVPLANSPEVPEGQVSMVGPYGETAGQKAIRDKETAQEKADIGVDAEIDKLKGKAKEERIDLVIDSGIAAADVVPTYNRMLELVEVVNTGGIQAGLQRARQLFGWEAADMGELDVLFKEAVLGNIKKMGANPTEGERKFLIESSGSIGQNPALLKRLITRRLRSAQRDVEMGKKWAKRRGDDDAIDIIDSTLTPAAAIINFEDLPE